MSQIDEYHCTITDIKTGDNIEKAGEEAYNIKKALDNVYEDSPAYIQPKMEICMLEKNNILTRTYESLILYIEFANETKSSVYEICRTFDDEIIIYNKESKSPHVLSPVFIEILRNYIWAR